MANYSLEKAILKQENGILAAINKDLIEKNKELNEIIDTVVTENKALEVKNTHLMGVIEGLGEEIESLEEEIEGLDNEYQRLSDALEEEESGVIHYIAVSLDLEKCIPLMSESPIEAGQELIKKCLAKGIPYGGFKVFEKSELL